MNLSLSPRIDIKSEAPGAQPTTGWGTLTAPLVEEFIAQEFSPALGLYRQFFVSSIVEQGRVANLNESSELGTTVYAAFADSPNLPPFNDFLKGLIVDAGVERLAEASGIPLVSTATRADTQRAGEIQGSLAA